MNGIDELIAAVERARTAYVALVEGISPEQGTFRVADDAWSIGQITEHLVHAEQGGINLIWRAADAVRRGEPVWQGESENRGLSIEQVVDRTWRPRETSPESALPRLGGSLGFWTAALRSCTVLLAEVRRPLAGLNPEDVVYPHVISGPLDARQRLEFLRFHLERHRAQVVSTLEHGATP